MTKSTPITDWKKKLSLAVPECIASAFADRHLGAWQENAISTALLKTCQGIGTHIAPTESSASHWRALKLSGQLEEDCGDIAIVVTIGLTNGPDITGVAYYEAKRQYFDPKNNDIQGFKQLDPKQLKRISSATHAARVLFYDYIPQPSQGIARVLPIPIVLAYLNKNPPLITGANARNCLGYSLQWPDQLYRNLLGYDLDFSVEIGELRDKLNAAYVIQAVTNSSKKRLLPEFPDIEGYEPFSGKGLDSDISRGPNI